MHKKSFWKLRKISRNVKPTETNSRQRFRLSGLWTLAYVSSNPINIRYFKWVYRWKISIFNLKMEFLFQ